MKRTLFFRNVLLIILVLSFSYHAYSQYPGQFADKIRVQVKVPVKAYSFDLKDVKLLNSPFYQNMERDGKWLLSLDQRRLLHNYRINAGIRTNAKAYGGWEALDVELRGHTLGHVMSGLAMMYASTGNIAYKNRGDSIVMALAECQKALDRDGYLSAYPEYFIDRVIAGQGVWAPWYTLHKIYAGLLDMYLYADNQQALEVLNKAAGWAYKKIGSLTEDQLAVMLRTEFGGMNEVFYNLYSVTGNPDHKKLAECFYHHAVLDPLAARTDQLNKLHANTQIPKITGEARAFELTGEEKSRTTAEFFWKTVIENHTYANGGNSDYERFFDPGKLSLHISPRTTETCNTYNMLKLTRHLFEWTAGAEYADYYENALYNHILASQDPETGMVCYFMPFTPGSFKVYSTPENSFWCCVGTGFENHAKYAEGIYYNNDRTLFVNLFIPSELDWKSQGMKLKQETDYPESDKTTFSIINAPVEAITISVRYPSWAVSGASVKVNGRNVRVSAKPGSYINVTRKWKSGDKMEVRFPMNLRLVPTPDDPRKAVIAYGPVLLAGAMGTEGIKSPAPYANDQNDFNKYPVPENLIHELRLSRENLNSGLKPVTGEPVTFITSSGVAEKEVRLIPYYKLHHQRYVLYWDLKE
ncbi:MAG TPA: glycoside hydrolase family 127 protein [Bacteroidales bacterium]|nr:glycoside hydrolase family 127 protein [Bacteroidales bacterium]HOU03353.1 glycoside hydrolase family 127 protein [Bacteroidales bacterium]HQG63716.1 glycoside hydrolase family 127 protein [Bacteroidales bacterium]HQK68818.1 glycoside hydrolase family 127 protein [Bacteroidales bacterium]